MREADEACAEAEALRAGLEEICADAPGGDDESNREWKVAILRLLDKVDARDSLAHLERVDELRAALHVALDNWTDANADAYRGGVERGDDKQAIANLRELAGDRVGHLVSAVGTVGMVWADALPGTEEGQRLEEARTRRERNEANAAAEQRLEVERILTTAAKQDIALVAQAKLIAAHWIGQEGVNGAELDKLARIVDPTWVVMPPGGPPLTAASGWRDFGNTIERELARMSDAELVREAKRLDRELAAARECGAPPTLPSGMKARWIWRGNGRMLGAFDNLSTQVATWIVDGEPGARELQYLGLCDSKVVSQPERPIDFDGVWSLNATELQLSADQLDVRGSARLTIRGKAKVVDVVLATEGVWDPQTRTTTHPFGVILPISLMSVTDGARGMLGRAIDMWMMPPGADWSDAMEAAFVRCGRLIVPRGDR